MEQMITKDAISRSTEQLSIEQERLQLSYRKFELGETDLVRL